MSKSTSIGNVISISSSSIILRLSSKVSSGLLVLEGRTHKVGQVGSFIRIPQGYNDLYGVIAASNESSLIDEFDGIQSDRRLLTVELIGESSGGFFERGISQYPSVNDEVHLVMDKDLAAIYGDQGHNMVSIGKLSSSESIDVNIDIDKLVTRHSAILGSTGSGKSTSVSSILRSISNNSHTERSSARIILIDIHGEYSSALKDISKTFSIEPKVSEEKLVIPYWAISPDKLIDFLFGNINETSKNIIFEMITEQKKHFSKVNNIDIDENKITTYSPIPFDLKKIWYELCYNDTVTFLDEDKTQPAYKDDQKGDSKQLVPPKFLPPNPGTKPPNKGGGHVLTRNLEQMRSRLLDNQFSFFLSPDDYIPGDDGKINKDLNSLTNSWIGHDKSISIIDLSGMPSTQLDMLLGSILDIIFEASIWGRNLNIGMKKRPVLLVLEEAHRYLSVKEEGLSKFMVQRIAKEGRKFGVGAMIVSQRPSEIDETILSQCGTLFALRLSNSNDRSRVKSAMSDGLSALIDSLPILRTGEAIIIGEATKLPSRCKIKLPPEGFYPDSADPQVSISWGEENVDTEDDYIPLIKAWRKTKPLKDEEI
ncbi:ATP-binding protein [Rahnella victoriana]|uniref:ATP-binding protein n=1 Tax=Rahnella victoriana TaxID=1510570 RepID=UPI000BB1845B|nr:ATP-binding protein [Rahnella victoriana]PBI82047.1 ATPase [Rahnella victoriana]TBX34680.1 ATP-binding protein [Rahnella victoriana]